MTAPKYQRLTDCVMDIILRGRTGLTPWEGEGCSEAEAASIKENENYVINEVRIPGLKTEITENKNHLEEHVKNMGAGLHDIISNLEEFSNNEPQVSAILDNVRKLADSEFWIAAYTVVTYEEQDFFRYSNRARQAETARNAASKKSNAKKEQLRGVVKRLHKDGEKLSISEECARLLQPRIKVMLLSLSKKDGGVKDQNKLWPKDEPGLWAIKSAIKAVLQDKC